MALCRSGLKSNSNEVLRYQYVGYAFNGASAMMSIEHESPLRGLTIVAATVAVLCVPGASAIAQVTSGSDSNVTEQITVTPPQYNITRTPVPDAAKHGFAVAQATSISLPISYSDLDLSTPAGVKELEKRVTQTATDICRELNRQFPPDLYWSVTQFQPGRRYDCVQSAVKDAMAQIMTPQRLAVASASR